MVFITPPTDGSISCFQSTAYTRSKVLWCYLFQAAAKFPSPYRFSWASGDRNILQITAPGLADQQLDINDWRRAVKQGAQNLEETMRKALANLDISLDGCYKRLPDHIHDRRHQSSFLDDHDTGLAPVLNNITEELMASLDTKLSKRKRTRISPHNRLVKEIFAADRRFQVLLAFILAATLGFPGRAFQVLALHVRPSSSSTFRNWFFTDDGLVTGWPEKKGSDRMLRQDTVWLVPPSVAPLLVIYYGSFRPFLIDLLKKPGIFNKNTELDTLESIRTHPFVHTGPADAGRVWTARDLNRALNTAIETPHTPALIKGLNDKIMRHIFQCCMERFMPNVALEMKPHIRKCPVEANDTDNSIIAFNLSAGHSSKTADTHYGNTTDTQPHPSQSMSKSLYTSLLAISKIWQVWLLLRKLDHDLVMRSGLMHPGWLKDHNMLIAIGRVRHLSRRIFEKLDIDTRVARWRYLEDNQPYLRSLDVSLSFLADVGR